MPETHSARRESRGLEERFNSASPSTRHEYLDVHFLTAGVDVVVQHSLLPVAPDAVVYEVVQASTPVNIYHDTSADRRAWTQTEVVLRSNVSNVVVRLLLTTAAGTEGEGIQDMGPAGATYTPAGLVVQGNLQVDEDLGVLGDAAIEGVLNANGALNVDGAADFDSAVDVAGQATLRALVDLIGGQIKFPATAVPSADANTLDDYEEGTFTPALSFGTGTVGITYSTQLGAYLKIGKQVTVAVFIALSSKGSSTGNAEILNMPFSISFNSVANMVVGGTGGGAAPPYILIGTAASGLLYQASLAPLTDAHFTNTTFFYFTYTGILTSA